MLVAQRAVTGSNFIGVHKNLMTIGFGSIIPGLKGLMVSRSVKVTATPETTPEGEKVLLIKSTFLTRIGKTTTRE